MVILSVAGAQNSGQIRSKQKRALTVGFGSPEVVALFLAVAVSIIAHILERASSLDKENKSFV